MMTKITVAILAASVANVYVQGEMVCGKFYEFDCIHADGLEV